MKYKKTIALCLAFVVLCLAGCGLRNFEKENQELLELISPIPIPISATNTDAAEPAVAIGKDGSTYVVWVDHRANGQADVLMKKVPPTSADSSTAVRVNPEIGKATAWRGDPPSVAIAPDGTIFVVWTLRTAEKGHDNNLYLSASRDGGVTFETPVKINDDVKPAVHGMHSLAIDNKGKIYVAWLDERNVAPSAPVQKHRGEAQAMEANREVFVAFSEDGGRTISKNQLIANEACPCCKTAITTATDGKVYVAWRQVLKGDLRHIAVSASVDNGLTYSSPVIVSDDKWVIAGCPVSGPALSARENGDVKVLWYTKGEAGTEGLYIARSVDSGRTFSSRNLVSSGVVTGNPLLMLDTKTNTEIALWQSGDLILKRAEITVDGGIQTSETLTTKGTLPSAALAKGRSALAYISGVNKQRSVWVEILTDKKSASN